MHSSFLNTKTPLSDIPVIRQKFVALDGNIKDFIVLLAVYRPQKAVQQW